MDWWGHADQAPDVSENGNDGTFHGTAEWVTDGKFDAGISLKGHQNFVEVPNVIRQTGSFLFWFKPDWDGKDSEDFRIFDASLGRIYFFIAKEAAHTDITPKDFGFYFESADDSDWQDVKFDPAGVIEKHQWFHVAATWDFAGGFPFLYINGKQIASSEKKITGGLPVLHQPRFGWKTINYIPIRYGAEGRIDEISFWQRVLNEDEIQYLMSFNLLTAVEPTHKIATTWTEIKIF